MSESQSTTLTPVQIAETITAFGWVPIGLSGKAPIAKEWQKTQMNGAIDKIKNFYQANPQINVGVLTGKPSGIVIADIEQPNVDAWLKLVDEKGMPRTFVVLTGSGGFHYYFKLDDKVRNLSSTKIKGLGDYLADGRQAVFPGSINYEKQTQYTVIEGYDVEPQSGHSYPVLASMPDWLVTHINPNAHMMASIMPSTLKLTLNVQQPVAPPTINQALLPPTVSQQPAVVPPQQPAPVVEQPVVVPPPTVEQPVVVPPVVEQASAVPTIPQSTLMVPTIPQSALVVPIIPTLGKPSIPTIAPTLTN